MFSFFKKKPADVSSVHPTVGATLTRAAAFPNPIEPPALPVTCRRAAVEGVPPLAKLVDEHIEGQTSYAYIVSNPGRPTLAAVNVTDKDGVVELWELSEQLEFVRKRAVRVDPEQSSWITYLFTDAACLPGDRLLLGIYFIAQQVKQALFVYDISNNTFTRLADVARDVDDRERFFTAQPAAANASIVLYNTGQVRTAPEQYYNAFNHLVLFTPQHPTGLEILKLAAADGSVRRWTVIDKTLWLQATDRRDPRKPADFVWSLDLSKVL